MGPATLEIALRPTPCAVAIGLINDSIIVCISSSGVDPKRRSASQFDPRFPVLSIFSSGLSKTEGEVSSNRFPPLYAIVGLFAI